MKKSVRIILFIICLAVFLVSGGYLVNYMYHSAESKHEYKDLAQIVEDARQEQLSQTEKPEKTPGEKENPGEETKAPEDACLTEVTDAFTGEKRQILSEYAPLYDLNPDFIGWIKIDGTNINYPVMQSHEYRDYYLHVSF